MTPREKADAALERAHATDEALSTARRRKTAARAVYEAAERTYRDAATASDAVWHAADQAEDEAVAAGYPDRRQAAG